MCTTFAKTKRKKDKSCEADLLPCVFQTEKRVTVEGMTEITLAQGKAVLFKVYSAQFPFEYQK